MKNYVSIFFILVILSSCNQSNENLSSQRNEEDFKIVKHQQKVESLFLLGSTSRDTKSNSSFTAKEILLSYEKAYGDKVNNISYRNNDWAIQIFDQWFYWADGKLLNEELLEIKDQFNSYPYYKYPKVLPEFIELSQEAKERIDSILELRETKPLYRSENFLDSLWRIKDRQSSWDRVKTTYFLGFKIQFHRDLLEDLALVEEDILEKMKVDNELYNFVKSLKRIDGYNWRQIAETKTRSVHSYGIALDLFLSDDINKEIYWLWPKNSGRIWYDIPYDQRFSPPDLFIEAFERQGFIWGGKWLFFDTIHFEYRPEILILNNY